MVLWLNKVMGQYCIMKNLLTQKIHSSMSNFSQQWLNAWNCHDVEMLLTFYDKNFGSEIVSEDYSYHDHHSVEEMAQRFFNAFPDLHFELKETIEQGDKVSMLWVGSGTHKGTYNHIPPTGKRLEVNGTSFLELKNGKIIKATFLWDGADMLRQMGLLPEVQLA